MDDFVQGFNFHCIFLNFGSFDCNFGQFFNGVHVTHAFLISCGCPLGYVTPLDLTAVASWAPDCCPLASHGAVV